MHGQGHYYFSIPEELLVQSLEKDDNYGKSSQHQSHLQGIVHVELSKKHSIVVYLGPFV